MRLTFHRAQSVLMHLAVLAIGIWLCPAALAQKPPERFWMAGRYDGDRVIVYFNAVHFRGTLPPSAKRIADPVVKGFYRPRQLAASYVAQFVATPDAEHFSLGMKYDLILDYGHVATATLTTLVGTEGDEPVGNDSYIGALASLDNKDDWMFMTGNGVYVLRRHVKAPNVQPKSAPTPETLYPGLEQGPVRFDIQTKIVGLLSDRMETTAKANEKLGVADISPVVAVQEFRLADGKLRYYARAVWNSGEGDSLKTVFALSGWISPSPKLHILAVEERESGYNGLGTLPELCQVVDLEAGRTGIIVSRSYDDGASTVLMEYVDGADLKNMRILQILESGE